MLMAKLVETKVLPAPGLVDVNIITCISLDFTRINSMLVRMIRKASDTESRLCSLTTMACLSFLSFNGISPKKGIETTPSTSLRECTFVSFVTISQMIPAGIAQPTTKAAKRIIIDFGAIGADDPDAGSIMRALLSVMACVKAFSSRLFSK